MISPNDAVMALSAFDGGLLSLIAICEGAPCGGHPYPEQVQTSMTFPQFEPRTHNVASDITD